MKINIEIVEQKSITQNDGRKNFGEVFTPNILVEEMLNTLPSEVWSNPNLKWLDPAAGNGNFFAAAFNRLMIGLKDFENNDSLRAKHILESMLFFVELQDKNSSNIKEIFNKNNEYKLNLFEGDFYQYTAMEFGFFDIVLGNPPYQDTMQNEGRKAKNHNLWSFFIEKGFELLKPNGYLLYITPPAWMSPSSNVLKSIFLKHQIHYINLEKCNIYFQGIGSKFSYYLVQKKAITTPTVFDYKFIGNSRLQKEESKAEVLLNSSIKFIPQLPSNLAFNILEKTVFSNLPKLLIQYDSDLHRFTKKELLSEIETSVFKYKIIHTPSQHLWSLRPHKNFGLIKVFIPLTTYYEDIIIDTCGNTQGMGYIISKTNQEAELLKKLLLSKLFIFIANITRWSNFNVPEVMKLLPSINNLNVEINDEFVYQFFKLNKKEIIYIENLVKEFKLKKSNQLELEIAI